MPMKDLLVFAGFRFTGDFIEISTLMKRVKIDVGLSVNAPQSQNWLISDDSLLVIGIEPLQSNISSIRSANTQWQVALDPKYLENRIFLVPVALSDEIDENGLTFYVTKDDPGRSSLLKPKNFEVLRTEIVPVSTLNELLKFFPFQNIPIIDHLKIDAQGSDLKILRGCSNYLKNIFAITVEMDTDEYEGTDNSIESVSTFLEPYGFERFKPGLISNLKFLMKGLKIDVETDDPTFINRSARNLSKRRRFFIYQRG
jgi:FkbM family methyltransferase